MLGIEHRRTHPNVAKRREYAGVGDINTVDWDALKQNELYAAINRKKRALNSTSEKRIKRAKRMYSNLAEWFDLDYSKLLRIIHSIEGEMNNG